MYVHTIHTPLLRQWCVRCGTPSISHVITVRTHDWLLECETAVLTLPSRRGHGVGVLSDACSCQSGITLVQVSCTKLSGDLIQERQCLRVCQLLRRCSSILCTSPFQRQRHSWKQFRSVHPLSAAGSAPPTVLVLPHPL